MSTAQLSIIIVNWNTKELLLHCLQSIYASPPEEPFEVVVVDNASVDGSVELVRQHFPQATLLVNRENVGFARANNQGIAISSGPCLLLLNSDTEVCPRALQSLARFMDENPKAGAAGARLLNADGSLQRSCFPSPSVEREFRHLFHLDRYERTVMDGWDTKTPREVEGLLGACIMVRRQVLDEVGLLDEQFFMYSEEMDLCARIRRAGWKLFWVPEATIVHYGGQSARQMPLQMFLQLYWSKLAYFRKHHGHKTARWYKGVLLAAAVARIVVAPLAYLQRPGQRERNLALAGRYWQLLLSLPNM